MRTKFCFLATIVWFYATASMHSQECRDSLSLKSTNEATLFGIGKSFLTDTYLSPLEYEGISFSLLHDRLNGSKLFKGRLLMQQQFQLQIATTKNPTKTASSYYGNIYYGINGFYPLVRTDKFRFFAGGGAIGELGGIYNERNSNNPGSLKVSVNLDAAAMAIYRLKNVTFRWQLSTPFLGMFFSPEYGHSYYEIFSLGNDKGTVHLGSFHDQLALRNYFTIDFPIGKFTVRTGYLGNYYRTDINNLTTKILSHQFVIGLANKTLNFGGSKIKENRHWLKSVYYDE